MIVFDLACRSQGHVFEAWFGSTGDYEDQARRGLLACPICGASEVDKAVMAPNVGIKGNRKASSPASGSREVAVPPAAPAVPMAGGPPDAAALKAMLRALAEAQARVLETSSYVGDRFADEARAIHHGESEQRPIHGQATLDQAKALIEDGIEVAPLPFPVTPPENLN